jgi:hypothetical protein
LQIARSARRDLTKLLATSEERWGRIGMSRYDLHERMDVDEQR